MTKKRSSRQQLEKPQFDFKLAEINHGPADNNDLENEIGCPACQSIMTLSSTYDSPYYGCNECNFCLYIQNDNRLLSIQQENRR
jgi:C4-type Zn-finger protein